MKEGKYMTYPLVNTGKNLNKFTLCTITGKRARQLIDGVHQLTNCSSNNAVVVAINEIDENKITFRRRKK